MRRHLYALLQGKRIAGAGLDVTEVEPISNDSPLLGMDNTIITPHALCWTDECFADIASTALQSIVDLAQGPASETCCEWSGCGRVGRNLACGQRTVVLCAGIKFELGWCVRTGGQQRNSKQTGILAWLSKTVPAPSENRSSFDLPAGRVVGDTQYLLR